LYKTITKQQNYFTYLNNAATVLFFPYKDLTSSHKFSCPLSGNIYV